MLNRLELEGFKSFVSDEIEFADLTLLTGLNSSGKSSVIQALLLLEKAAFGEPIYLSGHGNILESKNSFIDDGIKINSISNDGNVNIYNDTLVQNTSKSFPEIIYVAADRYGPETIVAVDSNSQKLGKRGENIFKVIADNESVLVPEMLRHEKSQGDTFLYNLVAWLNIISKNVKLETFLQPKSDSSYATFNGYRAKNVGFGLSYTLTVITALLLGSIHPNSIVIIENPEAHLHPRGQTEMARLIGLCADAGVQIIVETHSDHLFDGIRHYVKKHPNFSDKVICYWFELDENGNTEIQDVKIDKNGRVSNFPPGMFDQFIINASNLL